MSREEAQTPTCDIRSVLSPYPLVLPYPLPRYTGACAEKGPAVPELQVRHHLTTIRKSNHEKVNHLGYVLYTGLLDTRRMLHINTPGGGWGELSTEYVVTSLYRM